MDGAACESVRNCFSRRNKKMLERKMVVSSPVVDLSGNTCPPPFFLIENCCLYTQMYETGIHAK